MKKPIQIGEKLYKSKSEALLYYKTILNSYDFGESLSDEHYFDIIDLLDYDYDFDKKEINLPTSQILENENVFEINKNEVEDLFIDDIQIGTSQFNTKCFELVWSDLSTEFISYLIILNRPKIDEDRLFYKACRNVVYKDIIALKQQYFKDNTQGGGFVKCQETGDLCKWDNLVVDHRQPNTLSIIVDRFKEVNQLSISCVEYITNEGNLILFKDESLAEKFRIYHKEKANLRVVKKELNSSRASMGCVKQNSKDLKIK